jgi:hypothetical protein
MRQFDLFLLRVAGFVASVRITWGAGGGVEW